MSALLHRLLPGDILKMRLNKTLHGRSKYRKKDVEHHNVVRFYNVPGVNDALDVFCAKGTEVYATHDGEITRFGPHNGKLDCCYLDGKVGGKRVITCYAHLHYKDSIGLGSRVKRGQVIGYVAAEVRDPHLHVEVEIDGKPLAAKTPNVLARLIVQNVGS